MRRVSLHITEVSSPTIVFPPSRRSVKTLKLLTKMFLARITMSYKNHKSSTCFVGVTEKPDESLSSFMDCFNDETSQIEDSDQNVALYPLV